MSRRNFAAFIATLTVSAGLAALAGAFVFSAPTAPALCLALVTLAIYMLVG